MWRVVRELMEIREDAPNGLPDYLSSFDLFAGIEAEGAAYLADSLQRFLATLRLVPPGRQGERLLELGANPYFFTLMLKKLRPYDLSLANYFGPSHAHERRGTQTIQSVRYGETHVFHYDHFNVETDRFPYDDAVFDVVLCCEIIEHLTLDPVFMLAEIHRVLKPGGRVVITTPNVNRFQNLFGMALGRNLYDPYSGYGPYGRHNREYTVGEMRELLTACGYTQIDARGVGIHSHTLTRRVAGRLRPDTWRDSVHAVAVATGRPRLKYPTWLFRSMEGVLRITDSDITIDQNDDMHLGAGWHPVEHLDVAVRWTGAKAQAFLWRAPNHTRLHARVNPGPAQLGPVSLTVTAAAAERQFQLTPATWTDIELGLPPGEPGELAVVFQADPVRRPIDAGIGKDTRNLGVQVQCIWLTD